LDFDVSKVTLPVKKSYACAERETSGSFILGLGKIIQYFIIVLI